MKNYTVIVGNIGNVLETNSLKKAVKTFNKYVTFSKKDYGRAGHEDVTLFNNKFNDIEKEYIH